MDGVAMLDIGNAPPARGWGQPGGFMETTISDRGLLRWVVRSPLEAFLLHFVDVTIDLSGIDYEPNE
jgi:hypothetical protein